MPSSKIDSTSLLRTALTGALPIVAVTAVLFSATFATPADAFGGRYRSGIWQRLNAIIEEFQELRQEKDVEERNREVVESLYEVVFNGHDVEAATDFLAEDYIQHNPTVPQGVAGFQGFFEFFFEASPDAHWELFNVVVDGDTVVVYSRASGTFTGYFGDAFVEDRAYDFTLADVFRLEDGIVVEHWDVIDNLTFFSQLGVL